MSRIGQRVELDGNIKCRNEIKEESEPDRLMIWHEGIDDWNYQRR